MPTTQPALFDDASRSGPRKAEGLRLLARPASRLNKQQQDFNRLVGTIERLRTRLDADRRRFDEALVFHAEHLRPRIDRLVGLRKEFIHAVRPFLDDRRLTPRDRRDLRTILIEQLDDVLACVEAPEPDLQAIFERLHGARLEDVARQELDIVREEIEGVFAEAGVHLDLSGFQIGMSEDDLAVQAAEMADDLRRQAEADWSRAAAGRRRTPTKRQLRDEERARQQEELRKVSLGSVYRRLVKALHPDLEPDAAARAHKSALMQEVTAAYAASDLHGLLHLEFRWIHQEQTDLARLTDDTLRAYNRILKEQIAGLQDELAMLPLHPRYEPLQEHAPFGTVLLLDGAAEANRLDNLITSRAASLERLQTNRALQEVRTAIQEHRRAVRSQR